MAVFSYMKRDRGFYREVFTLASPIILQNFVTSTLSMADTFMVGLLGQLPMAAVALANIPLSVVQFFVFGVQSGSTVLFSQYWGRQDREAINRVLAVGIWFAAALSLTVALILIFIPEAFLSLFGNDPEIIALAAEYGRLAGMSWVLNSVTMVYIAAYRSMERPQLGMYILVASMACNTFLNWVFIFGNLGAPVLGVKGAALATLLARILELVMIGLHIWRSQSFRLRFSLLLRPGTEMIRRFLSYGMPVVWNETLWGAGTAMFPTIMGHMVGSQDILAAYTICGNVEKLCQVMAVGFAATAAILVGREIGAARREGVLQVAWILTTLTTLCGLALGALLLLAVWTFFPICVFPVFRLTPAAISSAGMMIAIQALVLPLRSFNNALITGVLRGGGDVRAATLIDLGPLWLASIPAAALMGLVLRLSIFWVCLSIPLEHVIKALLGLRRMKSGAWIHDLTRFER